MKPYKAFPDLIGFYSFPLHGGGGNANGSVENYWGDRLCIVAES